MLIETKVVGRDHEEPRSRGNSPDGSVESCNPEDVVFRGSPAPQKGIPIDPTFSGSSCPDESDGWDKGNSVADQEIPLLHLLQPFCVILVIESQIDIASHGQGPQNICYHEPATALALTCKSSWPPFQDPRKWQWTGRGTYS